MRKQESGKHSITAQQIADTTVIRKTTRQTQTENTSLADRKHSATSIYNSEEEEPRTTGNFLRAITIFLSLYLQKKNVIWVKQLSGSSTMAFLAFAMLLLAINGLSSESPC